jgi:hypothetical protein
VPPPPPLQLLKMVRVSFDSVLIWNSTGPATCDMQSKSCAEHLVSNHELLQLLQDVIQMTPATAAASCVTQRILSEGAVLALNLFTSGFILFRLFLFLLSPCSILVNSSFASDLMRLFLP